MASTGSSKKPASLRPRNSVGLGTEDKSFASGSLAKNKAPAKADSDKRVGLSGLVFIVISAMIGGGVFMMPAQMSNPEANGQPCVGPGSEIFAWLITALGMWFLVCTFRMLTKMRPDLKAGMFSYAHSGFGKLVGFLVAWGYWLFNVVSCAAYGVLVMGTLHYFFPAIFTTPNGNSLIAIVAASILSWFMVFLASRGAKESAGLNIIGTIAKIVPIVAFIVICLAFFNPQTFTTDFWALSANQQQALSFTGLLGQVGPCMMVTLWVFLGIEGAVVVSGQAKSQKDVSRATLIGFLATLIIYLLVSLLPFGLYTPEKLGNFANPSMGTIMADHFGPAGIAFINVGIIISVISAWLVWILMLSQMPLYAAREKLFPACFKKQNKHDAPTTALLWSGVVAQFILIASLFLTGNAWDLLTNVTSAMAAPCYLFCALYLLKIGLVKAEWKKTKSAKGVRWQTIVVGILATAFGIFLVFAGNIRYLLVAFIVYAAGMPFFLFTRRKYLGSWQEVKRDFLTPEWIAMGIIVVLGILGIVMLCTGAVL